MTDGSSADTLDLLSLLDELRIITGNGLAYTGDHDEGRYSRLRELVETYYGRTLDFPDDEVAERLIVITVSLFRIDRTKACGHSDKSLQ